MYNSYISTNRLDLSEKIYQVKSIYFSDPKITTGLKTILNVLLLISDMFFRYYGNFIG